MIIGRTLFWFKDGDEQLIYLDEMFFGLGVLLNRLLNESYSGKKIKFINIDFSTHITYDLHPVLIRNSTYYHRGHLRYYGVFDLSGFTEIGKDAQAQFIWEAAYTYLQACGKATNNDKLIEASKHAYDKGVEISLNPNYRVVETTVFLFGQLIQACIWINFKPDGMYSKLSLEKDGQVLFEKHIDKAKNGVEFFLIMYKSIEAKDDYIVVKGLKDVDYLPMKIKIDANYFNAE